MTEPEPKLVVFDLFDTILDKVWFDYSKALDYLLSNVFTGVEQSELNEWATEYRNRFLMNRDETRAEYSFTDQLRFYEQKSGIGCSDRYGNIEWGAFRACREERIGPNVPEAIESLKSSGYRIAILSNSIFSSDCLLRYLDLFGLGRHFDRVFSSADLGIRKPSPRVFLHVCAEFNKEPSDVWFIGNNLKKDVHGASDAGLNAIFYNRANDEYGGYSVKDLLEVRDIVR